MTMTKGDGSEITKQEKTVATASNEEVLKALKSYQEKIAELEAKIQTQSSPSGKGFEANQDFSRYKIFNVKGRITVKK